MALFFARIVFAAALAAAPATLVAQNAAGLAGNWQGTLTLGANTMRIGLIVTTTPTGGYNASLVAIDQDGGTIPAQVTLMGNTLHLDIAVIRGSYDGTLSGQDITGTFTQGMPQPLIFKRVDKLDPPPTFASADEAAVRTVINAYFSSFTAQDWDTFRTVLNAPFTLWAVGGTPNVLTMVDDVVARMRTTREGLSNTDYAVSKAARMLITPLSSRSALADIHWRRDKKDGSLFGEGAEILTVVKTPAGWKIAGNMARQLSQYGKSF